MVEILSVRCLLVFLIRKICLNVLLFSGWIREVLIVMYSFLVMFVRFIVLFIGYLIEMILSFLM